MNANHIQNIFSQIIKKNKLPKYIWFIILRIAKLQYYFGSEVFITINGYKFYDSIQLCRAGNTKLFIKAFVPSLKKIYYKKALKRAFADILTYLDKFINSNDKFNISCRYMPYNSQKNIYLNQVGINNICKRGNIKDIKFLLEYVQNTESLFKIVCEKGSLENIKIIEEIILNKLDYFDFLLLLNKIIEKAVQKKNYKLCSYFFEKYNLNIDNFIY